MSRFGVSLVYEPRSGDRPNEAKRYDIFMRDLEGHLQQEIPRHHGLLSDLLPLDGYLLVRPADPLRLIDDYSAETRRAMARSILFDLTSSDMYDVLERARPAGAFDVIAFGSWATRPYLERGARGLYGYTRLASGIGAHPDTDTVTHVLKSGMQVPERNVPSYSRLESETHESFTHLLADYLRALASDDSSSP